MRIFLLRHGETALNAAGVLRGQLDVALNAVGEAQALALGASFAAVALEKVVSSPLVRALDTARAVTARCGAPLSVDDRLRDRFYGEFAGRPVAEAEKEYGSIDAVSSVESLQALGDRAEEALVAAAESAKGHGPVALVTHDAIIRALLDRLVPGIGSLAIVLPTGSWSELEAESLTGPWSATRLGELPSSGARP